MTDTGHLMPSVKALLVSLQQPSRDFAPAPFWFWNYKTEPVEIARQVEMMAEKGLSGFLVHARYGMQDEYLSEEWFRLFGHAVAEAKRTGLKVWIYDDANWPSGVAGGKVMAHSPSHQSQFMELLLEEPAPGEVVRDSERDKSGREVLIAARFDKTTATSEEPRLVETYSVSPGAKWSAPSPADGRGYWKLCRFRVVRDPYYSDVLNPKVVDYFKNITYEEYYRRYGAEFGSQIVAVFTDEPSLFWASAGYENWRLPYTDALFETFRARYGYSLPEKLPYLFFDGTESSLVRRDFWDCVSELFVGSYHRILRDWCAAHGVAYTGHANCEEPLRHQVRFQGDLFRVVREFDIPGIDHLTKATWGNTFASVIGHKVVSSVAHHYGRKRVLSESFGVSGWDVTFDDLRHIVNWQFALGINFIVPHALYYSIAGPRKRESPPSLFYQSRLWHDFGDLSAYVARLSAALTGGRHVADVAVWYPITGLWSSYLPQRPTDELAAIEDGLNQVSRALLENHFDFDFVSPNEMPLAAADSGRMRLGEESYSMLIVPPCRHLADAEIAFLERMAAAGVKVLLLGAPPCSVEKGQAVLPAGARQLKDESELLIVLREEGPDVAIAGRGAEQVYCLHRQKDGYDIYLFFNHGSQDAMVNIELAAKGVPLSLDLEAGTLGAVGRRNQSTGRADAHTDGGTGFSLALAPGNARIIVLARAESFDAAEWLPSPNVSGPHDTDDSAWRGESLHLPAWRFSAPYNALVITSYEHWAIPAAQAARPIEELLPAAVWTGFSVVQAPRSYPVFWDPKANPTDLLPGLYRARFEWQGIPGQEMETPPGPLWMVLDGEYATYEVWLNGNRVKLSKWEKDARIDVGDVGADVTAYVRPGNNEVLIRTNERLSEPMRIVGHFLVAGHRLQAGPPPHEVSLGSWTDFGYPFFSGTARYETSFILDARDADGQAQGKSRYLLDLGRVADVASVWANGTFVGKRLWAPFRFDITRYVQPGKNRIEVEVTNGSVNCLMGDTKESGLLDIPEVLIVPTGDPGNPAALEAPMERQELVG